MTPPRETVLFEAISTPPQSFTLRGFRVLAGLLILAAAIPAGIFFALGAWPVLPFIGLEVGAALAALLWHARASRRISEMVLLTDAGLSIRHVDHRGRVVRSVLDAYWAKVEWDEADQTKHFQAKWNHLATRKMRSNEAFSSQVESLGDSENAIKHWFRSSSAALSRGR